MYFSVGYFLMLDTNVEFGSIIPPSSKTPRARERERERESQSIKVLIF